MSRILHLEAREAHIPFSVRMFMRMNTSGVSNVDSTVSTITMVNGDEHVFKSFGNGNWLRGTEWDCVIVSEDIRQYMPIGDYEFMCELVPTRVRPHPHEVSPLVPMLSLELASATRDQVFTAVGKRDIPLDILGEVLCQLLVRVNRKGHLTVDDALDMCGFAQVKLPPAD